MKALPLLALPALAVLIAAVGAVDLSVEPIVSRIPRAPVQSSALAAVGYSKRLHALEIEFVNGAIYRYLEVPPSVHRGLMSAGSKARFYHARVRGQYRSLHVKSRRKK